MIRDIRAPFEKEEADYYKPKRINNLCKNNYIEYENSGDKSRNLSLDKYLNKIKLFLRNIRIVLQNSSTW